MNDDDQERGACRICHQMVGIEYGLDDDGDNCCHPCRIAELEAELAEAKKELHTWRTNRLHGGCHEELMAEVSRRAEAENERDALKQQLEALEATNRKKDHA
jgi:hypothetical protein